MIFGKHINRYYLRYGLWLLLGLAALVGVDYLQLEIPKLYGMVVNGMNDGFVVIDGVEHAFDLDFLLDHIWGYDTDTESNVVWVYISYLRKKLVALGADVKIKATRNAGYSIEADE